MSSAERPTVYVNCEPGTIGAYLEEEKQCRALSRQFLADEISAEELLDAVSQIRAAQKQ